MAGIIDLITGQNPNQGAVNAATNASNQATGAENQLIQQGLLPIYNQELNSYNQNYAPYEQQAGQQASAGANAGGGVGQTSQNAINAYQNADSATGINQNGITQQNLSYLTNPNGTNLTGAYGNAQNAISQALGNLGQVTNQNQSDVGSAVNQLASTTNTNQANVGGAANQLANTNSQISSALNPNLSATTATVGQTLPFYLNEMQNGLSPQSIGAAENNYANGVQSTINSERNSLGAGVPNLTGMISDAGEQAIMGQANLASSLAGQNQGVQQQGAAGANSTANQYDTNYQNELLDQANLASGTNQAMLGASNASNNYAQGLNSAMLNASGAKQSYQSGLNSATDQAAQNTLSNAGALDQQNANMLSGAQQSGQSAQNSDLANIAAAYGISDQEMTQLMQYLQGGQGLLTGAAGGMSNLAGLYGNAASGAAQQASNAQQQGNAQNAQLGQTAGSIAAFFA